jgi:hypothetical protein
VTNSSGTCPSLLGINPFLIFGAAAALVVCGALYSYYLRRKALAELAASMGLEFSKDGPDAGLLSRTGLQLFSAGRSRKASNLIAARTGAKGPEISFFDYSYTTGSGKNSHSHSFTVALFDYKSRSLPSFDLEPENILHKLGELVGFKDIDIPSAPVFSSKYRLTGDKEPEVVSFFCPEAVAWLERNTGWRAQACGCHLLLTRSSGQVRAADYPAFMIDAKDLAAAFVK